MYIQDTDFQESTVLTMIHYCFHSHLICLDK